MASIEVIVPMFGTVESVIVTPTKTWTTGDNDALGLSDIITLVGGTLPTSQIRKVMVTQDPDNNQCTIELSSDDTDWISRATTYFATNNTRDKLVDKQAYVVPITDGIGETGEFEISGSKRADTSTHIQPLTRND
jgi:hypothetical protein